MKLLRQLVTKYKSIPIDLPEVREEFQNFSGLEESIFDASYSFEKQEVRKKISTALVGQPEAVDTLADVIHTIKAKLANPDKPLGSFMFIGPTGVGKTQAAKVLCKYLMGDEKHLMRFDMNEYIDESAVHRLIGDYYNPEGQLTGKVRYNPFGILLLDEIEKAHPQVHDLLLLVLDDGRLTDGQGRVVNFRNTVIVMTSNVGTSFIKSAGAVGFAGMVKDSESERSHKQIDDALKRTFRPEFINRIDEVIVFEQLSKEQVIEIVDLQMNDIQKRLSEHNLSIELTDATKEWLAEEGYDKNFGARPLKRALQRYIESPLSVKMLKGEFEKGDHVVADYADGEVIFVKKEGKSKPEASAPDVEVAVEA